MKLGILGAGNVGDSVAYVAYASGIVKEIYIHDINEQRAKSVAKDVNDAAVFVPHFSQCKAVSLEALASCDIVVVSVGKIADSADRLAEIAYNKEQLSKTIPVIAQAGFKGKFIVISNPCDIMTYYVYKLSGLPFNHVIGTGTGIDSARLQIELAKRLDVASKSVHAVMLGEHGDSQFTVLSQAKVGVQKLDAYLAETGKSIDVAEVEEAVRQRGREIFIGKKCTQYGIASTANRLIKALVADSKEVFCVSTLMQGEYGLEDIYISTPALIGKDGVEKKFTLELNAAEKAKLDHSAAIISKKISEL